MLKSMSLIQDLFTVGESSLSSLPYVITAFMIGLVLAQVYMTLCRSFEAKLLRTLHDAGAIGSDKAVPLCALIPNKKWERFIFRLLSSPSPSLYRWVSHDILDARAQGGFTPKTRGEKGEKIRMNITPDTKLYIKEDAIPYVEERGIKFTSEQWMTVIYTALAAAIAWFILLYLLDDILALVL